MIKNCLKIILILQIILFMGCSGTRLVRNMVPADELPAQSVKNMFIKIHMNNGDLYVLNEFKANDELRLITGTGQYFDFNRNLKTSATTAQNIENYTLSYDNISLIETNRIEKHLGNIAAIGIVGIPIALLTAYCITNPKACFGSCPTFYAMKDGNWELMAEGFSSSILPSLEKRDIDMPYHADPGKGEVSLKLTNEALETHVIRYVDLLAFPHKEGEKVFATNNGHFYRTGNLTAPLSCLAEEGDCRELVSNMDYLERYTESDQKNLAKREEIILEFEGKPGKEHGLLIGSRQTFLTTYLFYQGLAHAGNYYGFMAAEAERGNPYFREGIQKIWDKLGVIEIFYLDHNKKWQNLDEIDEMGPIAADVLLVKLPEISQEIITIKLKLTKGLWRIDYLALAEIKNQEEPYRVSPISVVTEDADEHESWLRLTGGEEPLVTYPGEEYLLNYKMPGDGQYQYFIDTKGYYLEWMRDEWLEEEDLRKVAFSFRHPGLFMRLAASEFKKVEPHMEKTFWESRYVKNR